MPLLVPSKSVDLCSSHDVLFHGFTTINNTFISQSCVLPIKYFNGIKTWVNGTPKQQNSEFQFKKPYILPLVYLQSCFQCLSRTCSMPMALSLSTGPDLALCLTHVAHNDGSLSPWIKLPYFYANTSSHTCNAIHHSGKLSGPKGRRGRFPPSWRSQHYRRKRTSGPAMGWAGEVEFDQVI
jgi:hypothetical protein